MSCRIFTAISATSIHLLLLTALIRSAAAFSISTLHANPATPPAAVRISSSDQSDTSSLYELPAVSSALKSIFSHSYFTFALPQAVCASKTQSPTSSWPSRATVASPSTRLTEHITASSLRPASLRTSISTPPSTLHARSDRTPIAFQRPSQNNTANMSPSSTQTPIDAHAQLTEHRDRPVQLITDKLETPSLDDRSYRVIKLPNDLEVLLVHDAETDKASASMDVNVGAFKDGESMPGLAHSLEHMLFMGTKKVIWT